MEHQNILRAKEYFYNKDYKKAQDIFMMYQQWYYSGFCALLTGNEDNALKLWSIDYKNSISSHWGMCVLDLINLRANLRPTTFETRAFLEVYLNLLIENNFIEWAQNLVSMADFLNQTNPEAYKFIGRALYSNGYFELAISFLKKSLNIFSFDPEASLIVAQCYYLLGNIGDAVDVTNKILAVFEDYYPAILFRNTIKK